MNNEWGLSVPYWINIWMKGLWHEICELKLGDTKSIEGFYPILIEFILLRDWTFKNVLHPFIWGNFRNFHSIMNIWKARVFELEQCVIYNQQNKILQTLHVTFFMFYHNLYCYVGADKFYSWHYALIINISYPGNFNKHINIL